MNKQNIKSVVVDRLKNGFLISPRTNHLVSYDECIFIEGFDATRLAENISSMLCVEVEDTEEARRG